ncbi:MAG TPA: amidohydrolase family protein [Actinomycetota bacterium]|nr:amidohydrolase family protein [Actinomycetota bacterium]
MTAVDVESLRLIDHHCHGVVKADLDVAGFEDLITESSDRPPGGTSRFDSPLGLAVRRWCAPVLGLEPFPSPDEYVARRAELGADEVARSLLKEAGLGGLLLDTGYRSEELHDVKAMGYLAGVPVYEIVRLEAVAEAVAASGVDASSYPNAYRETLEESSREAVGLKTIVAYRGGFSFEPEEPTDAEVVRAAGTFLEAAASGHPRLADPVMLRFGIWSGARLARERGLPIQFHSGWGDADLDLHLSNPTLLTGLIRQLDRLEVKVVFLHCYPFHRDAAYLSSVYGNVYFDVGSALHYHGPSSARLLAEAMEVAPFSKLLFSSDAFGLAEQYHLGAMLFRRALREVLDGWVEADHCDAATAVRIAQGIARGNALRIYPLP